MKTWNKQTLPKLCVWIGVGLLAIGAAVLLIWQWNVHAAIRRSDACVQTLRTLMPTPQGAVPEERRDNTMSVLAVDGEDFVGILEMPRYDSALPIGAQWGGLTKHPCRFDGSVYDGTLQIGATTQKGQYAFYRDISVGDTVLFTDVEGNRYTYAVTHLRYAKHADQTALQREEAALTLFIKNVYDFEYLLVFCDVVR